MDAMSTPDHGGIAMFTGHGHQGRHEIVQGEHDDVSGIADHRAPCRIDDIGRGQTVMDP